MAFLDSKVDAIWTAVERACLTDDFRPKRSVLCDYCAFKAYCPAFGGDPMLARARCRRADPRACALVDGVADAPFGPTVARFDEAVDAWFDGLRGNPVADRIFYLASALGDFSLIWHLAGFARAALGAGRRAAATPSSLR